MIQESLHSRKVVWVIDDDVTALLLSEEELSRAGFKVRTFSDASDALTAAQAKLPDIIVVDVIMPHLNGFEFCFRLRSHPQCCDVPILMATSLDDSDSIKRAFEAGATDFTTKPLNWKIETHRLRYILRTADMARELRLKERETRLAKEDWGRTFDSITDSVMVLGTDMKILRANSATARLFGDTPENITGRYCHELFHCSGQPCSNCPGIGTLKTNSPATAELACGPSGSLFEIAVSPVTDSQGRVTHLVHVARDLSERKQLEAELRHAQKMEAMGALAGGIAHDFNNMLTVIQGFAEMLVEEEAAAGRNNESLQAIVETAMRGSALTKQLLIFSRKKSHFGQKRLVDLNDTLKNIGRMLEKGLPKTVSQKFLLADDLRKINADSGQLEQVVMNLAVNASHAMPAGGTITIETQNVRLEPAYCYSHPDIKPGDYVLLAVSDTGHGMDKQTQARIYEPFFTTKRPGEGTGLGLSVVFGIVQEHGGHIACYSEVGVGTTFRIYLPLASQYVVELPPTSANTQAMPRGSETVLVVDDEAPIRGLLERHLAKLGYAVVSAGDGETALRRYTETGHHPHAVILDLGMPNMSGWECLEKLRRLDPQVKVLIVSGYGGADLESRVLAHGACGFMCKPYNLMAISKKLREILDSPSNTAPRSVVAA